MTSAKGYQLAMDWTRHGVFTNPYEDVTADISRSPEVSITWGRTEPRATEEAAVGKLTATLLNHTRKYSPENTASVLSGKVMTGVPVRYQVTNPADGSITTLFSGPADEIDIGSGPAKPVDVTGLDAWGTPDAENLSTQVYTGQRTGYLIGVVLDLIGWTGPRDIDAGATVVPYWWEEGTGADEAIRKLVQSEGPPAIAFVENGVFVFHDRHHRLQLPRSQTSQGSYTHIIPAGTGPVGDHKILRDTFSYNHGLNTIVNSVTFNVDRRALGNVAEIWRTDDPIVLASNEVRQLAISTSDAFMNAITPEQARSYDTDGNPLGDYVLSSGSLTFTLSRTSGQSVYLTLTAGASGAYLPTGLILRANPVLVNSTVKVTAEDAGSIGLRRRQTWPHDLPWCNEYDAQAIAERLIAVYATPRPTVVLTVAGVTAASLTRILNAKISDRIYIRNDDHGIAGDFYIETITHTITRNGQIHKLTIGAQAVDPVQPSNVLTFDVVGKGITDGAFGVTGLNNPGTMLLFDTALVAQSFDAGQFAS